MLNGQREGWIEVAIIVEGNDVTPEPPLVKAVALGELASFRHRLLGLPGAKTGGADLADGDVLLDFHRDEPGEGGGVEFYILDPVAFSAEDAHAVLPAVLGLPAEELLRLAGPHGRATKG